MEHLIEIIIHWALGLIEQFGYGGIGITQALESFLIPIPSEVVLPFGGFLASTGALAFWGVVAVATLGNMIGCLIGYVVGRHGGRPLLERYGRYVLVFPVDIIRFDDLIRRRGRTVAFIARVLPGVRTFSSVIIGSFNIRFSVFFWYTLVGSFLWNLPLAYVGYKVGKNWNFLRPYIHKFDILIVILGLVVVGYFLYHQIRKLKANRV